MRRIFLNFLFILFTIAVGCRKDRPASQGNVSGGFEYYSRCKSEVDTNDLHGNDSVLILFAYDDSQKRLQITHVNAVLNSRCDSICCDISNFGTRISIDVRELLPRSQNLGYYNLKMDIKGVEPTTYTLIIQEPVSSNKEKIVFTLNLGADKEGLLMFPQQYLNKLGVKYANGRSVKVKSYVEDEN